jgi:hypothetical protein
MLYAFFWVIPRRGITKKKEYNKSNIVWLTQHIEQPPRPTLELDDQ